MSTGADWISQHDLLRTDYAMLAMTSTVFIARVGVQVWRRKPIEAQDILLYIAFAAYLAFTILYIVITPIFFKLQALQAGRIAPWPTMMEDIIFAAKVMWQSGMEYWTCLWFVKFSLLSLYKKLLSGMPKKYLWIWWFTLIFCVVTWATCIITGPGLACNDTKSFLGEGVLCSSSSETRRQTANLYYAYAVDTVTNMMVMFLPIRLIWNLQMEKPKKIGCGLLFASGLVCILFSTIRIVQVGQDGRPRSPDPKWLTMWTIIECSTAIIIGCCPGLASAVPKSRFRRTDSISYDTQGYVRQSPNRSSGNAPKSHGLRNMLGSRNRDKNSEKMSGDISMSRTGHESEEQLPERRTTGSGVLITDELREQQRLRMEEDERMEEARLKFEQSHA
ncbi:hypothetical protein J4E83_004146 [Alternaria metachromatica]|uniref:uncharacterized protein n=1 Tax=Alternaria metachromatica TaxID=283354 RepID=UPI0020C55928|nr:uncharacterized protein J4E83_004146 [Alternaria metachromatica]KAI4624471.1 hypothetical protein J4E83_004146 [Alternaria metachromatica]